MPQRVGAFCPFVIWEKIIPMRCLGRSCQTRNGMIRPMSASCAFGICEKIIPMRCLGRIALLLLLGTSAASAQVKETIDVHLVEVPVTVVDRAGNPVRGLTAANFELFDQGTKRTIGNFEAIDFESEAVRSASPLNPAARRNFILLFDLSFSSPIGRNKAQEAARNFIAKAMGRRDLAAVATIDVERGFRMVTSLTTDRNLLGSAIANPRNFFSSDPLRIAGSGVLEAPPSDNVSRADVNAVDDFAVDIARGEKKLNDQYNRTRIERQLHLLSDPGNESILAVHLPPNGDHYVLGVNQNFPHRRQTSVSCICICRSARPRGCTALP